MTPKELLYIEDTLGHLKHMEIKCNDYASRIIDPELKAYVQQMATKVQQCFNNFYQLL